MSELNPLHVPKSFVSQKDERRHRRPVLESHLDLLRGERFSDVTFVVGPSKERIQCHQFFLKSRSPVFQAMFSEQWKYNKEIPLEDVEPKTFRKLLEFIYADTFEATVPEAVELLQVAHKYRVHMLVDKCEKLLHNEVSINYAVHVFQAARKYGSIQLMEKVGDLMSKSLSELQSLPSFSWLDTETLTVLLKRNDLKMKELDVFRLALQWANNQSGITVQEKLKDILPHIRFPLMTLQEFTQYVVPTGLLSQTKVIELYTYFGSDAETKKSLAGTLELNTQRRDSIGSVAIYSGDYENKDVSFHKFIKLQECLQFSIHEASVKLPHKSRNLGCGDETEASVGLNGLSVYCPARESRYGGGGYFTKFKIQLVATDYVEGKVVNPEQNYKELLAMSAVEMEEGRITEIKFKTVIPVRSRTLYSIMVEETRLTVSSKMPYKCNIVNHFYGFRAKDFGRIADHVDVNIGNKCHAVLNIRTNDYNYSRMRQIDVENPQLICKLGFEEL